MGVAHYFIPDEQLARLAGTRQGRISVAGFLYQAAYAEARLASMCVARPCLGLGDWPARLRYDWGEDLDESLHDGSVVHTQCKRVAEIGQPASLAIVLLGFAAKWLWTPVPHRDRVRFRLVCCDPRFPFPKPLSEYLDAQTRRSVQDHFLSVLNQAPSSSADRALWQLDADRLGHRVLFNEIFEATEAVYLKEVAESLHPAGSLLFAEREALGLLLVHRSIGSLRQKEGLAKLRFLIHQNVVEFDPLGTRELEPIKRKPRELEPVDVQSALFELRDTPSLIPFRIIDASYLEEQLMFEPGHYVARPPEWKDVVRGADNVVKFVEREATEDLEQAILKQLIKPMLEGIDSRLRALFVVGPPGAGKSTLARRVAARLVVQRRVIVADAATGEPCDEPDDYVTCLAELQAMGRPVLFLLDDPLTEGSEWYKVLDKLNRPGFRVAVMAASPEILYDRFRNRLPRTAQVQTYPLDHPAESDRAALARLYGIDEETFRDRENDEFLVLAMEAASGVSFDEIIGRIWYTLNGGRPISAQLLSDLPVAVRAFLVTCFFHRANLPCQWPILEAFVASTGIEQAMLTDAELARLRNQQGWAIFRFIEADRQNWAYMGIGVKAMHQRVAQRAWEKRPLPWLDQIWQDVVSASVKAPHSARSVVQLAAALTKSDDKRDQTFVDTLVGAWGVVGNEAIPTRHLAELATGLMTLGVPDHAKGLAAALTARARPSTDGWIAALQLWYLAHHNSGRGSFPGSLDLPAIIRAANFALAPNRATKFFRRLSVNATWNALAIERLCQAFDGQLDWRLESSLLLWLMMHAETQKILLRLPNVIVWLKNRPKDLNIRVQFLTFLSALPREYDSDRRKAVTDHFAWLDEHPQDSNVRVQFLTFLSALPERLKGLKAEGADLIAEWVITQVLSRQWASALEQRDREVVLVALNLVANNASAAQVKRVLHQAAAIFTTPDRAGGLGVLVEGLTSLYHRLRGAKDQSLSSKETEQVLRDAKSAIEKWIELNPNAVPGFPWLPLP